MSETYSSKRERRQRLLESLPADLRPHVSIRNVEAVASLTPQAQARLMRHPQSSTAMVMVTNGKLLPG